jgi:hypothetical protein
MVTLKMHFRSSSSKDQIWNKKKTKIKCCFISITSSKMTVCNMLEREKMWMICFNWSVVSLWNDWNLSRKKWQLCSYQSTNPSPSPHPSNNSTKYHRPLFGTSSSSSPMISCAILLQSFHCLTLINPFVLFCFDSIDIEESDIFFIRTAISFDRKYWNVWIRESLSSISTCSVSSPCTQWRFSQFGTF